MKWISYRSSEPLLGVRIPPGAPVGVASVLIYNLQLCGYRLVVGHVLAKDEVGVRFSLPAPKVLFYIGQNVKTVDNIGDSGYKTVKIWLIYVSFVSFNLKTIWGLVRLKIVKLEM